MIRIVFIIVGLSLTLLLPAQERKIVSIPDIPGYLTLRCDFHMHTVFSDGYVWPTVRVDEAWREGLDAIAITDHLEYLPHKDDICSDHNRSWNIAKAYAEGKDVIVIAGTEITKPMPPGHLNAIFIKDANAVLQDDFRLAVEEAAEQGAFIMWNHPGWKAQQPDTMKWWNEHTYLYEKGWLHGIEVANYHEFYPEAIDWAIGKELAVLGNSDVHAPVGMTFDLEEGHRTYTLVFATEKSEGAIREALFNGRTLAFIDDVMMGKQVLLEALFKASVERVQAESGPIYLKNATDLSFNLRLTNRVYLDWTQELELKPHHESVIRIPSDAKAGEIDIEVMNMHSGTNAHLVMPMSEL